MLIVGYIIVFLVLLVMGYDTYNIIKPHIILAHAEYHIMMYQIQKGEFNWTDFVNQMRK